MKMENKIGKLLQPHILLTAYLVVHVFIRLFFSQTLQVDDAEQIRLSQELLLGYGIPQPPLYSWVIWGMFQIFGIGLFALTLLKYTLISLTFWLTWLVSGQLFQHLQTRYIVIFSYLLMPSFAWHMHQGFTHTVMLSFGIILSLHALLCVKNNPNVKNYIYLGLAFGIGLMGKYSFLLFMVAILVSALSINSYRKIIFDSKIFLAIGAFVLMIGPHAYWLSQHYQEIFISIDHKLQVTSDNTLIDRAQSAWQFSTAAVAFVVPFALVFLINSWRRLFNTDKQLTKQDNILLLNRFYWAIIISVIVLVLFVSMPHFKVRWFHPLMMIFPLWMMIRIERQELLSKSIIRWFSTILIIFTFLILSIRLLQVTIGPNLGNYGRLNIPIHGTLNKLDNSLLDSSTLKTNDAFLGAHLLSKYPN
ncbi:MAG TPA: glycosyltransferase family 39 protein, partial [Candidatus Thioglobus sp.]|nr:glycosyltransferase family 39 protein [Candidatus Thioglobus sp.]